METSISLPDELAQFIEAEISTGRYASANEVVREALRVMAEFE